MDRPPRLGEELQAYTQLCIKTTLTGRSAYGVLTSENMADNGESLRRSNDRERKGKFNEDLCVSSSYSHNV